MFLNLPLSKPVGFVLWINHGKWGVKISRDTSTMVITMRTKDQEHDEDVNIF